MARILIIDDEVNIRTALARLLERQGHTSMTAAGGRDGLQELERNAAELVVLDLRMPEMGGIELLRQIKKRWPETEVVVMTAFGSVETAVEAMKAGAYDYLTKPIDKDRFPLLVEKAVEHHQLASENRQLRRRLTEGGTFEKMVGQSDAMRRVFDLIDLVARSDATVLLAGESGTGKELVARAIHRRSRRVAGPFIGINCGALPESIFESEMFGYEKGAFTGAVASKPGRFELADGGTLFLDEIGELSPKNQVDFLRVLETMEFRRLGGTKLIRVSVRVIAATNRDLKQEVSEGRFRDDLYYRLHVVPIEVPPLRSRREDIPLLIQDSLIELTAAQQLPPKEFTPEALRLLIEYAWPGNVRELKNVLARLMITVREVVITPEHLPVEIRTGEHRGVNVAVPSGLTLREVERRVIERTLAEITHNRDKAAKVLGISRRALQYKLRSYGIND